MKTTIIAIRIFLVLTLLCGVAYPLAVTGIAQVFFKGKANGSLIIQAEKIIGSELIGQATDSAKYFSPRPSATSYNTLPSGGSNLGLTSTKLQQQVSERKAAFINFNGLAANAEVPSEMLFASASGLDPHISPEAALLQVDRLARTRNLSSIKKKKLIQLVHKQTEEAQLGILGETRVNVLKLNLALDKMSPIK